MLNLKMEFANNQYQCHTIYNLKDYPKDAGFRWEMEKKYWYTDNIVAAKKLIEKLKTDKIEVEQTPEFENQYTKEVKNHKSNLKAASKVSSKFKAPAPAGLEYLPYQKAGIEYASKKGNALFADEMGLGKTIQAIGVINTKPDVKRLLVLCPATLKTNWKRELKKWLVNDDLRNAISVVGNKIELSTDDVICDVMNYDLASKKSAILESVEYDYVIFDEAHYLKNGESKRTIAALKIQSKNFLALTGTPFLNNPFEIFTIANKLDPESFRTYGSFGYRYCSGHFQKVEPASLKNLEELQAKLKEAGMIRRLKKDVLKELPDKIHSTLAIPTDNSNSDFKFAIRAEGQFIEKSFKEYNSIMTALAKMTKKTEQYDEKLKELRALRTDFMSQMSRIRRETATAKAPIVVEYLQEAVESQGKVVFFAHHSDVLDIVQNKLAEAGIKAVRVDGSMSQKARQASIDGFQSGDAQVFIGSIRACSEGITLTASSTVYFGEMDWTPAKMMQCEDRCHRIGQKNSVSVINVVVENTIDDYIASTLANKRIVIGKLLDEESDQDGEYKEFSFYDFFKYFGKDAEIIGEEEIQAA
ncbi:DEAD/DEAH box helicase [Pseudomonas fulva]|uniref:DEAD/DEAH box helicase n=1 Tax=Pseudomonas fulva TaxID=47880 RepID=UPI0015E33F95|nr:DEAD/DEAH box helicase [Pseudomonas fulva]MBA1220053.1 DEAD/DEAH box helicase [Pseudomonas fulva]